MRCGASSCDDAVQAARLPVGQTRWSPPRTIGPGWYRPEIGRDIRGQALVVWQHASAIHAASFAKGRWARPWVVTRLAEGRFPEPLKFATNRSGNAALVWGNRQRLVRTPVWLEASVRLRDGRWLPTRILSDDGAGSPSVAIDEAGTAIVVWQSRGRPDVIESATRRAGTRSWSRPRVLGHGSFPSVAVDGRGNFWAAWSGTRGVEIARRRARATGWERPRVLAATAPAYGPTLAVGRGGTVALAWEHSGVIEATRLSSPAASWEPARVVSHGFALNPAVAVDGRGTTFVTWEYFTGGTASTIEAVVRAATASDWPTPVEIAQKAPTRRTPSQVLAHGTNKALAAWNSASNVEIAAFNGR